MNALAIKNKINLVFASRSKANAVFLALYSLITRGTTFIIVFAFAKFLEPSEFGLFSLLTSTALLFSTFVGINLSQVLIIQISKSVAEKRNINHSLKALGWVLLGFFALIFLLYFVFYNQIVASVGINDLMCMKVYLPVLIVVSILSPLLSGIGLGLNIVKSQTILLLFVLPLVFGLLYIYQSYQTLSAAVLIYLIIQILLSVSQIRTVLSKALQRSKTLPNEHKSVRLIAGDYIKKSIPLILGGIFTLPTLWYLQVSLRHIPNGGFELGLYGIANQIRAILFFIIGTICSAILPSLAVAGSYEKAHKLAFRAMRILVLINVAALLLYLLVGKFLLSSLYAKYIDSYWSILVVIVSTIFTSVTSVSSRLATSMGKNNWVLYSNVGFGVAIVVLCWVLISKGALGASLIILLASFLQTLIMAALLKFK